MMNGFKREPGLTLVEIMVILAVIAIIAASMVPRISGIIENAKISRAQSEVQSIGMAILRFNANTGKWPARNAEGVDNVLETLVSGDGLNKIPLPPYVGEGDNYFGNTGDSAKGDYLENHLKLNRPKGNSEKAYATSGINRWNGPYLRAVGPDPWGNAYAVNIISAYDAAEDANLYCYVISAGPDGLVQTDADVREEELSSHAVAGDDVAFLVRARK